MFSLKKHARRNARIVAVGAAASMGLASAVQAVSIDWDPQHTAPVASGGTVAGTFDNSTANFVNGGVDAPAAVGDDTNFGVVGGTVNVPAGTVGDYNALTGGVHVRTINLNVGSYTINGGPIITGPLGGSGADGSAATLALSNTAGNNNVINSDLYLGSGNNSSNYSAIDVTGGTTLTVGNVTTSDYNALAKTGAGTLIMNGKYTNLRPGDTGAIAVRNGTLLMNGANSVLNGAQGVGQVHVLSGARLGGTGIIRFSGGGADNVDFASGSSLSPATNGTTGTLKLTGGQYSRSFDAHLRTGSHFEIDLVSPDAGANDFSGVHDVLNLTAGDYGGATYGGPSAVDIENGTLVDINGGTGTLVPGTYHIVRLFQAVSPISGVAAMHFVDLINDGFVTGNVPANYSYSFVTVPSSGQNLGGFDGIDLVVTASAGVPEPASLSLLGIGAGLLLTRKRRRAQT